MPAALPSGSLAADGAAPAEGQRQPAEQMQYLQVPQSQQTQQQKNVKIAGESSFPEAEVQLYEMNNQPSNGPRTDRLRSRSRTASNVTSTGRPRSQGPRTPSCSAIQFHEAGVRSVFGATTDSDEPEVLEDPVLKCYPKLWVVLLVAFVFTLLLLGAVLNGIWYSRIVADTNTMISIVNDGITNLSQSCQASVTVVVKETHERNAHAILEVVQDLLQRAPIVVTLNKDIFLSQATFTARNLTRDYFMLFAEMRDRLSRVDYNYLADGTGVYVGYGYYYLNSSSSTFFGGEYRPPDNFESSPVICPNFCPPLSEMKPGYKNYYFADNKTGRFLTNKTGNYLTYAPATEYDPRKRPWYRGAVEELGKVVWSGPDPFSNGLTFGLTASLAVKMPSEWAPIADEDSYMVFGADFALDILSSELQMLVINRTTRSYIVQTNGKMLASSGHRREVFRKNSTTGELRRLMWYETGDPSVVEPIRKLLKNHSTLRQIPRSGVDLVDAAGGMLVVAWIKWDWDTAYGRDWRHAQQDAPDLRGIIFSVQPEAEYIVGVSDIEKGVRNTFQDELARRVEFLRDQSWIILAVCAGFMILGASFIAWVSHAVVNPLKDISTDMFSIAKLEFLATSDLGMQGDNDELLLRGQDRMDTPGADAASVVSDLSDGEADSDTDSDSSPEAVMCVSSRPSSRRRSKTCWCWAHVAEKVQKVVSLRIREVAQMREAFEFMSSGLQSFSRYMDPHVVQLLVENKKQAKLGVGEAELTIFFSDIANFTSMAEVMEPKDLMDLLALYLDEMSLTIMQHKGVVGEYIGDAIMAWWNTPIECENHTMFALQAALAQQTRLRQLRRRWRKQGKPDVRARMGLVRGTVLAGNIGSSSRMKFGLVGDAVNLASRLEGLCKRYGVSILLDESACKAPGVADEFLCRPVDLVVVKGRHHPTELFELVGHRRSPEGEPADEKLLRFVDDFAAIHTLYRDGRWVQALQALDEYRAEWPDDVPAQLLHERCAPLVEDPPDPGEEWSAVRWMKSK